MINSTFTVHSIFAFALLFLRLVILFCFSIENVVGKTVKALSRNIPMLFGYLSD